MPHPHPPIPKKRTSMISGNSRELASAYLSHLATERRLSPLTCKSYARDIAVLVKLAQSLPLDQLEIHNIRRFSAQLHGKRVFRQKPRQDAFGMARILQISHARSRL